MARRRFVFPHLFLAGGVLLLAACSDPAGDARDAYVEACQDHRQACECQFGQLEKTLTDQELAGLTAFLRDLKRRTTDAGLGPSEMVAFDGPANVRREYFRAALTCTRF